ncbi:response regulator [uncultured Microscilla sp.]|uniref:response regulator n=1 Tax=uncultured Microscilla sp. TaxID=432653 RepID=UPI002620D982|nr:response regulator [uncultured Microscilla sp.]
MEPRILIIGRNLSVINILIDELEKFGRNVMGATDKPDIERLIQHHNPDLVVLGAGLSDKERDEMLVFLISVKANIKVQLIEKKEKSSPYDMVEFTNRKTVEWKVEQKLGKLAQK